MIEDRVKDIEESLEKFFSVEEVLPLTSKPLTGTNPVRMSILVQFEDSTVGKTNSCKLDVIEELKVKERKNLFAVFPIGAIMQDGGKRKRSDVSSYIIDKIVSTNIIKLQLLTLMKIHLVVNIS